MSARKASPQTTARQDAYLNAFSEALRELVAQGYDTHTAELLAHRDAAHLIKEGDARRERAQTDIQGAIDYGVELQRNATQRQGGRAAAQQVQTVIQWVVEQWQQRKHESVFKRMNARRGSVSAPSKRVFADHMTAPGGPLETRFPGQRFTAKTVAETWLKGL